MSKKKKEFVKKKHSNIYYGERSLKKLQLPCEKTETIYPVSTRRRFDVITTLFGCQRRCHSVVLTSCAYWVTTEIYLVYLSTHRAPGRVQGQPGTFFE